jgi:hypothetical protein
VVLANGAQWRSPTRLIEMPTTAVALNVLDVIAGVRATGNVLIAGGSAAGVQAALAIGAAGSATGITLLAVDTEELFRGIAKLERNYLQSVLLPKYGIRVVVGKSIAAAGGGCDTVVVAAPADAGTVLADAVRGLGREVHVIGDALRFSSVGDAIHSGARLARAL